LRPQATSRLHTCVRRQIAAKSPSSSSILVSICRSETPCRSTAGRRARRPFHRERNPRKLAIRDGRRVAQPEATPEPALATAHAVCRKRPSVVSLASSSSTESVLIAWLSRLGPLGSTWRRTGKSGSCSSCALLWPLWRGSSDTTDYAGRDLGPHKSSRPLAPISAPASSRRG
jgi:hypothetical protein